MAAVVAGIHNTESPYSGGWKGGNNGANAGEKEEPEEEVWEGEVAFEAAWESGFPSNDHSLSWNNGKVTPIVSLADRLLPVRQRWKGGTMEKEGKVVRWTNVVPKPQVKSILLCAYRAKAYKTQAWVFLVGPFWSCTGLRLHFKTSILLDF